MGRLEMPLSLGRMEPSATKETSPRRSSSQRMKYWSSARSDTAFTSWGRPVFIVKYSFDAPGQEVKQDLNQFTGINGPAVGRKTCLKAGRYALNTAFAGCPAENLRPWMAGGYQAAFAGTLCLKIVFGDLLAELPDQIILQGSLLVGGRQNIRWGRRPSGAE